MDSSEQKLATEFGQLLTGLTSQQTREALLAVLRTCREKRRTRSIRVDEDFGQKLVEVLARMKGVVADRSIGSAVLVAQHQEVFGLVEEAIWWAARVGLVVPSYGGGAPGVGLPDRDARVQHLFITEVGLRALLHGDELPFAPQFVHRLQSRCPGLPEDVLPQLEDAHRCHEAGLLRPCVTMLGLAYEATIEHVLDSLERQGHKAKMPPKAAHRIDLLAKLLAQLPLAEEDRRSASLALGFANELRNRRNDAAHTSPKYPLNDSAEVDELLLSAGRNLPALWRLGQGSSS